LLVLDELGYLPCDSRAADILYNIISRRHEQRSTIITTNLAFKQWCGIHSMAITETGPSRSPKPAHRDHRNRFIAIGGPANLAVIT
jgi:DNA replication protein DnaC